MPEPEPPPDLHEGEQIDVEQLKAMNLDINQRVRFFDHPFAYQLNNKLVNEFCSYCLRRGTAPLILHCGNCRFVRYCDKVCQKAHWRVHKPECARLMKVVPNLPLTDVMFLGKVIDRIMFIRENGDKYGYEKERPFDDLMDHAEEIEQSPSRMELFEKQYAKLEKYFVDSYLPTKERCFTIFCRTWINSHSIHNSGGTEVGLALDLGVSKYNHSCRPNGALVFDGYRAMIRPLESKLDAADWRKTCISYIDIGKSRYARRKELKTKWCFDCECSRCEDPDEGRLTAIRCYNEKCNEAILITEDMEPMGVACDKCNTICPEERVTIAQQFMLDLPSSFSVERTDENVTALKKLVEEAKVILHPDNIYFNRLLTAMQYVLAGDKGIIGDENVHRQVYENYKRCFPKADRHVGFQLANLVRSLIMNNKRQEAIQHAYEAMTIFEVCFGLSHPFYLQMLAVWTFLDQKADKTTDQLVSLLNFEDNRPIDIKPMLERAEELHKEEEDAKQAAHAEAEAKVKAEEQQQQQQQEQQQQQQQEHKQEPKQENQQQNGKPADELAAENPSEQAEKQAEGPKTDKADSKADNESSKTQDAPKPATEAPPVAKSSEPAKAPSNDDTKSGKTDAAAPKAPPKTEGKSGKKGKKKK